MNGRVMQIQTKPLYNIITKNGPIMPQDAKCACSGTLYAIIYANYINV